MSEKRTEQIAVRITAETKEILTKEAQKLDWSVSKLAEKILSTWTKESQENRTSSISFIIHNNNTININGG